MTIYGQPDRHAGYFKRSNCLPGCPGEPLEPLKPAGIVVKDATKHFFMSMLVNMLVRVCSYSAQTATKMLGQIARE